MTEPRLFALHRDRDVSGVSGTGIVADGVCWPDGTVSIRWRGAYPSTVSWNSVADAEHVHGHGGATRILWTNAAPPNPADAPADGRLRCCNCAAPVERVGDPSAWIHSPGSDTACLDAQPPGVCPRGGCRPDCAAVAYARQQDTARTAPDTDRTPDTPPTGQSRTPETPQANSPGQQDTAPDTAGHEFRDALGILLSRVRRGVQSTGEADLLAQHVDHLLRDCDRLARTIDRMKRTNRMVNGGARESRERAEEAAAALARVRAFADRLDADAGRIATGTVHSVAAHIRAAIDGPADNA
ncbi:hypothetical protein ACF082_29930 [Streptomyces lydicus]|uniref:hypothetical protein n=1 Tax=Streptomyces lydicus TaxID=47763 RepID=UPI0036FFA123